MKKNNFLTRINKTGFFKFISEIPEALFSIALILLVLLILYFFEQPKGFIHDQFPSIMLDIAIFGILIVVFNKLIERKRDIKRWQEEIDDYRHWAAPEATVRIVGNVKRLRRQGITSLYLDDCFLSEAKLSYIDLHGSSFEGADLRTVQFYNATLHHSLFCEARMQGAILVGADLKWADFSETKLQGADMFKATLTKADFRYAILDNAILREANLMGARNLKLDQLSRTKTLLGAKLDPEIVTQVREKYPHLLEEPKA